MRGANGKTAKRLKRSLLPIAAAWQFLTILPPLVRRPFVEDEMSRSTAFFPLIGVLAGAILAAADAGMSRSVPPNLSAAILLAIWVVLTGALHLDGFLDACDGLFGGRSPSERLRILKDERVGAFALAGGVLLLLIKYATIAAIQRRGPALIAAATLGRWAMIGALWIFPYVRDDGLGRSLKQGIGPSQVVLASAIASLAVVASTGRFGWKLVAVSIVAGGFVAQIARKRIGGLTGDILGAICEVVEAATLVFWSVLETSAR